MFINVQVFNDKLAAIICEERKKRNMTQEELAKNICVVSMISDIEKGKRKNVGFITIVKILHRLQIPIDAYLKYNNFSFDNDLTLDIIKIFYLISEDRFEKANKLLSTCENSHKEILSNLIEIQYEYHNGHHEKVKCLLDIFEQKSNNENSKSKTTHNFLLQSILNDIYFANQMMLNIESNLEADESFKENLLEHYEKVNLLQKYYPFEMTKLKLYAVNYFRHIADLDICNKIIENSLEDIKEFYLDNLYANYYKVKMINDFIYFKYEEAAITANKLLTFLCLTNREDNVQVVKNFIQDLCNRSSVFADYLKQTI